MRVVLYSSSSSGMFMAMVAIICTVLPETLQQSEKQHCYIVSRHTKTHVVAMRAMSTLRKSAEEYYVRKNAPSMLGFAFLLEHPAASKHTIACSGNGIYVPSDTNYLMREKAHFHAGKQIFLAKGPSQEPGRAQTASGTHCCNPRYFIASLTVKPCNELSKAFVTNSARLESRVR